MVASAFSQRIPCGQYFADLDDFFILSHLRWLN